MKHGIQLFSSRNVRIPLSVLFLLTVLVACGKNTPDPPDPSDSSQPVVEITSATSSQTAAYQLTGVAIDDVGVTELEYTHDGGDAQALSLTGNTFSAGLTLTDGANEINVTARDAAGNEGSHSLTVEYLAPPSGVSSSQTVAARGDDLVITGSGLGSSGEVLIGGVTVPTSSWSDSEITLTIPMTALSGPQTVTVSSPLGDSSFELFVGVAFPPGDLDDLVAAAHPKGTAVLLSAGTYTQAATELELDNLSFYGQGVDATTINTGASANTITFYADSDEHIVLQDLTLISDETYIAADSPGPLDPLNVGGADSLADSGALKALISAQLEQYASKGQLGTQATSTGSFRLENFRLQEIAGGAGLVTALMGAQLWVYGGDIELINAEFEAVDSRIGLITSGDVSITDSKIDGADFFLASFLGALTVDSSVVSARPALGVGGDPLMLYGTGLSINDSEVRSYAHTLQIIPFTILSGSPPPLPVNSSLQLINTTFRVTARDPVAAPGEGNLAILALAGESHINSNTFIVNGQLLSSNVGGSLAIRNNDFTIGHADIASSRYELTSVFAPGHLEFSNNTVTWSNTGELVAAGNFHHSIHDNTLTGNSTGTALYLTHDPAAPTAMDIRDNHIIDFENAVAIELAGAGAEQFNLTLTGNHFDFPIDALGKVAVLTDVVEASLDVDGNIWGEEDDVTILNSYIDETGTTTPGIMTITAVLSP